MLCSQLSPLRSPTLGHCSLPTASLSQPGFLPPFSVPPFGCQNNVLKPRSEHGISLLCAPQWLTIVTPGPPSLLVPFPGARQASHLGNPMTSPWLCSHQTCCLECCSQGPWPCSLFCLVNLNHLQAWLKCLIPDSRPDPLSYSRWHHLLTLDSLILFFHLSNSLAFC